MNAENYSKDDVEDKMFNNVIKHLSFSLAEKDKWMSLKMQWIMNNKESFD
jgi:hypothetical protein